MTDSPEPHTDPYDPARFTGSVTPDEGPSQDDIVRALKTVYDPEIPVIELAMMTVEGVDNAEAELVWSPPWDPSRMSEAARLELGMD